MTEPTWLLRSVIDMIHDIQLAEHGGSAGIRDDGLLESALARPKQLHTYGQGDVFDYAASYAYGIAKNHPFMDGNKRTALLAAYTFLQINGMELAASEIDAADATQALASGELDEAGYAAWLRENTS